MIILTLRSDKPEVEIGLFDGVVQLDYQMWQAHRKLAITLHQKIEDLLTGQGKTWADIEGIVTFRGPGSFTGLRIGLSVVNALAASYNIPAVGTTGDGWAQLGMSLLESAPVGAGMVMPEYGTPAYISTPKN